MPRFLKWRKMLLYLLSLFLILALFQTFYVYQWDKIPMKSVQIRMNAMKSVQIPMNAMKSVQIPMNAMKSVQKPMNAMKSVPSVKKAKRMSFGNTTYNLTWCPTLHLYRINGKPVLWLFWDKKPFPVHIKLSLATIMCHNQHDFHIQIVSEEELSAWIGDIHPAYQYLIPAHKGDYFRGRVLLNYGGIYMDADTIGLHNLLHLFDKLKVYDVVNIDWWVDRDQMSMTVMGPMRANTILMNHFVAKQEQFLSTKLADLQKTKLGGQYPIRWTEMLGEILLPIADRLLNETAYRYYKMNGPRTFGQLTKSRFKPHTRLGATKQFVIMDSELLMYHNSHMKGNLRNMSEEQFLPSDMLLPTLIRFTMNRCKENNFTDFPLKSQLRIGEDVRNVDKNLVAWIIDYSNNKLLLG